MNIAKVIIRACEEAKAFDEAYMIASQQSELFCWLEELKAYKATGLTPEGVAALQESNQEIKKEALPLLQAKIQDRLVVLPVKIGDKIFRLFNGKIEDLLVSNVIYRAVGGDACKILVECIPFHRIYWREDFGKTVFLSKEKAEAALKEREG